MRSEADLQISLDYIFGVCKIAALLAIAVNRRRLVIHEQLDNSRDHRRIRAIGPLTVAKTLKYRMP